MSYFLGIDLGTTYTAAAVCRDGRAEIARLGSRTPSIPSVVLLRDDGEVLTGEAAERRAITEPERVAREFKRRFGDPTPLIVGGTPYSADALTAKLLDAVVAKTTETEGHGPDGIVIAHPANWGDYKTDLLTQAVRLADLGDVSFVTEPEAAAIHYATQERVPRGAIVAVYDLGGGTFDAAVLARTEFGWQILGEPEGVEHLGGVDFDEAVFSHVAGSIGDDFDLLDPDDPAVLSAVARLRHECVEGKEALAADTDVVIPVLLPSASTQNEVRLTRSEFESMIRPAIADSIAALERALRAAGVAPADVTSVLLVGGSSRMPLVAEMVGSMLDRPVAVDAHPKHGVALGAAILADERGALAALTAAGRAASAAAASVAALASVRGATGDETALAARPDDVGSGGQPGRSGEGDRGDPENPDGTAPTAAGLAGAPKSAPAPTGPGDGTAAWPGDPGTEVAGAGPGTTVERGPGTAAMTRTGSSSPAPVEERTTGRDLPNVTPRGAPAYPGTGYYGPGTPGGPVRRTSSGSYRVAPPRRSPLRGAIVLGSLFAMIVALAAILFAYSNRGDDVFDTTPTTQEPPDRVTTTATTGPDEPDRGQPVPDRSTTTSSSSTTAATTTTTPTRTSPSTSTPPTSVVRTTTTPPTTEPPTTTEPPPTSSTAPPTTTPPTSDSTDS